MFKTPEARVTFSPTNRRTGRAPVPVPVTGKASHQIIALINDGTLTVPIRPTSRGIETPFSTAKTHNCPSPVKVHNDGPTFVIPNS